MTMGVEFGWLTPLLDGVIARFGRFFAPFSAHAQFAAISQAVAATLATELWQGLAIAVCVVLCLQLSPRLSAAVRFVVLAWGFVAVAALPFLPQAFRLLAQPYNTNPAEVSTSSAPLLMLDARWSMALAALWLAASLWRVADLAVHAVRLRTLWRRAVPVQTEIVFPALPGRRPVELCSTEDLEKPSVIGFLAPRILIPAWLLERMTAAELEQVALHETEHLRRGDDWTNLLQKLVLALFPLSPGLLWLERRLCLEREMACDEGVIRRTRAPRAYASCLTSLAERRLERRAHALSLGAWQKRPELARRVQRILLHRPALRPAAAGLLVGVMGCALLAAATELARCPQVVGFATAPSTTAHSATRQAYREQARQWVTASNADFAGDRVLRPELRALAVPTQAEPRPHMEELKATLPMPQNWTQARRASVSPAPNHGARQDSQVISSASHLQLLKAERTETVPMANGGAADADTQGWVVLTAWEQTDTPADLAQDTRNGHAQEAGSDALQSGANGIPGPASSTREVTVTRLIFRVTPAGQADRGPTQKTSAPPQPAIVPVRGGWLIFRL